LRNTLYIGVVFVDQLTIIGVGAVVVILCVCVLFGSLLRVRHANTL
jgi:hypothetical protein